MTDPHDANQLRAAIGELQAINSLIDRICRVRETNHIMSIIINDLVRLVHADQGVIHLLTTEDQSEGRTLVRTAPQKPGDLPFHVSEQLSGWVLINRVVLRVDDLDRDDRFHGLHSEGGRCQSVICAPMIARGETVGLLTLVRSRERGPFGDTEARLVGLAASQSAQILANALLLEELARKNALLVESSRQLQSENARLADAVAGSFSFEGIIGRSEVIRQVLTLASKVSSNDSPVLITGPTGTGKELVARAIHFASHRRGGPFVIKNCGVKTESLLESELFGHVKGAFTGADRNKPGLFREANGGTIFLDEIGDAPASTQTAILRVIETGEIRPVGATKSEFVDVRLISATNRDLQRGIDEGEFRRDLFYRINAVTIDIPPLCRRTDDIPLLVEHFLKKQRIRMHNPDLSITPEAVRALQRYSWPGNIRQLENEVERAAIVCDSGSMIDVADLSAEILKSVGEGDLSVETGQLRQAVEALEAEMIARTLRDTGGNIQKSARVLGLTRKGLKDKMSRYGITAQEAD